MAISSKLLNPGESVVISTRTHWKALVLPVLALVVVAAVAGFALSRLDNAVARWVVVVVAVVLLVWWTLLPFLRWVTSTYTVTSRRLITRHGILTRTGHDIPLNRISDVSYERGVVDRLVGCGTLIISDASTHGRVSLPDVPGVEAIQLKLSDLLYGHASATPEARSDEGA
ncbi:PH domain-containing protein [Nocardioides mangrovicus]|uniref:PH domain-containing protein n=1 Tax=Nocardioides mangrovicus TaxID=2478913 RepID=A0A3L8P4M2_9ACTN|nr:PH domain-containing protein [Nocardioides mangrovicus]RLV49927.1 PH domain-containing protein [Nocardioides mangrovicus]